MSPERDENGTRGIVRRVGSLPGPRRVEESWAGANRDKDEKLRIRSLQRRAGEGHYALRQSDYGWALIGTKGEIVDGRRDMSLKEIETYLTAALGR